MLECWGCSKEDRPQQTQHLREHTIVRENCKPSETRDGRIAVMSCYLQAYWDTDIPTRHIRVAGDLWSHMQSN
jgi:hypothetical protein